MDTPPTADTPAPPETPLTAIASLALGVAGFCLGLLTGIPAIVCGHLGLARIRREPQRFGGKPLAIVGLVLGYVTTTLSVLLVVALLILALVPALAAARDGARQAQSASHMRQIGITALSYSNDWNGYLPTSFEQLNDYMAEPYDPTSGHVPELLLVPGAEDRSQPSYEFVITQPTRIRDLADPSATVYIQEREDYWRRGRNILYADGHVQSTAAP